MKPGNTSQTQKMLAIFIFTMAMVGLARGISSLNEGFHVVKVLIIVLALIGAVFAAYTFFKVK